MRMPDHVLKSWPKFFQEIAAGRKKHDIRDKTEYDFKIGDWCLLKEYDPFLGSYTGETCLVEITYITSNDTPCAFSSAALGKDFAVLSFELVR
jgi:uncharacterized protein YqfB (UPF0267 family)